MSQRIELEPPRDLPVALAAAALAPIAPDGELEIPTLPRDLPQWASDTVSLSHRARELLAKLKPVVVRIQTFWDHTVRNIGIGNKRLSVDPSGSYRLN